MAAGNVALLGIGAMLAGCGGGGGDAWSYYDPWQPEEDASDSGDAELAGAGELGTPCYPNGTCDAGLECQAGRCVDPAAARGSVGGPCYPNSTCDSGLECADGLCVVPVPGPDAGLDAGGSDGGSGGGGSDGGDTPDRDDVDEPDGSHDDDGSVTTDGGTDTDVALDGGSDTDPDSPDADVERCSDGRLRCGSTEGEVCVDERSDSTNCGACGTRCASGGTCELGTCECPGVDGRDCGGVCRDVAVDVSNCGACGVLCSANATACTSGRCACATGWTGARCDEPICTGGCGPNERCSAPDRCECYDGFAGPTCSIGVARGFSFALINPGTFTMGSPIDELGRSDLGETQHTVTLTRRFLMQATEVTQGQWKALSGGVNPSCFQSTSGLECSTANANDNGPVEQTDWYSAVAFANALSVREGLSACYTLLGCSDAANGWKDGVHSGCTGATFAGLSCTGYRLPTESEWEYAARAGTTRATYAGDLTDAACDDTTLPSIAWFCGNSGNRTQSVALKRPNAWGLYDMLGNVWEWTWDRYGTYPGTVMDPIGPTTGSRRVLRGGDWRLYAYFARAASRGDSDPVYRSDAHGFRLARSLP